MPSLSDKYCLDANVLIQAWQKYYSPKFCPGYWDVLNSLGDAEIIFIPEQVYIEIDRTDDDLRNWLQTSRIPVHAIDNVVTKHLQEIYVKDPRHKLLVDSKKNRSLADPWVIAHAMKENACVVTKEEKITLASSKSVKIPNVCENMNVRCIHDFEFVDEMDIQFTAKIKI